MASGSSTTPATLLAGRCGVMARGCALGRQHSKIHPLCCFPALHLTLSHGLQDIYRAGGRKKKSHHMFHVLSEMEEGFLISKGTRSHCHLENKY